MRTRSSAIAENARRRWLRHSRSFKVTDFSTNRQAVSDFLLVNNTNYWHHILHHFQAISDCLSNFCFRQGRTSL